MINREVIYERTMTGSYMKIPMGMNPGLDERLMLRGKLKGTLAVEKTYIDGSGQYWYDISGKQSLDTYCRMKQIGIDFVERLVISICSELEILEWNLIHTNCLMLDPELVFVTNSNREFIFTLYPGNNSQIETEFQQLMEYLLTKIDHRDQMAVRAAYGIYEKTLEAGYSLMDIRDFVMKEKQQEQKEAEGTPSVDEREGRAGFSREKAGVTQAEPSSETSDEKRAKKGGLAKGALTKRARARGKEKFAVGKREEGMPAFGKRTERSEKTKASKAESGRSRELPEWVKKLKKYVEEQLGFSEEEHRPRTYETWETPGETRGRWDTEMSAVVYPEEEIYEVQPEISPTVCLSSYRNTPKGILVYQGVEDLQDISLGEKLVKIGHGKEADVRIERDTISQLHARIDRDGDNYYIEDLNSTNGTYINDEALVYKERRRLQAGDIVQLADVCYRFA